MRMTLYYLCHAVKNQIRKIFRTWVAVFILICLVAGIVIGLAVSALSSLFEKGGDEALAEAVETEEIAEPVENAENTGWDEETRNAVIELITGGVVLVVLVFAVFIADKAGSSIFLMADVNLLFSAPMRPQSVLLFRLIMQAGTSIVATLYMLFQLPNLILNLGLGVSAAFVMLGAWFLLLVYSKLTSVLVYTVATSHPAFKKRLRLLLYAVLAAIAGSFYLYYTRRGDGDLFGAARGFFNGPYSRYIPVWGWLKGMVLASAEGQPLFSLAYAGALLVGAVVMVLLIRSIKADFYEEAMARSEEMAAMLAAKQQQKGVNQRKKDRSDKLQRDGFHRGAGANVYFYKGIYNRFRFAHLHFFTKTCETYLFIGAVAAALILFLIKDISLFPLVPVVMAGFAFFRSLGNPVEEDVKQETFFLVPESAHKKVFFSFLACIANSAMDILPGYLLAAILLRANPAAALVWFLLIVTLGAYSSSVGVFIDLSLPTSLTQMVRTLVQVMFVYFGLAPAAVLIVLGFALGHLIPFALLTVAVNVGITALVLTLAPLFLEHGRR